MKLTDDKNRCVVTGLGMVCALGNSVEECFLSALKSVSGIAPARRVDTRGCYSNLSAEVKDGGFCQGNEETDRSSVLAMKAGREALTDAGILCKETDPRLSVITGSCIGGVLSGEKYYSGALDGEKAKNAIREMPIGSVGMHMAELCKAGGAVVNVANACAAGTIAISYACDLICDGKADVVVAGGTDSFASVPYAGFLALHALDPKGCSPFNRSEGITLGEGAGVLVVESYEHAKKRGAKIYCEVLGSGISGDAFDITAPRPDGQGQIFAIKTAIKNSGLEPRDVDYVNAHGTGTEKNDGAEVLSLRTVFDKNDDLKVSSTKAMTGHCLGAAGALEAVFCVKMLENDVVLPTLGFDGTLGKFQSESDKIDFVPDKPQRKKLNYVMNNSFAFGGNNASVAFGKKGKAVSHEKKENAVITGIGIVLPSAVGVDNYIKYCNSGAYTEETVRRTALNAGDFAAYGIKPSFCRKLDTISKLQTVSGMGALVDAGLKITAENEFDVGIVVGTGDGALGSGSEFQKLIAERGNAGGSAFKFPNTVYNAAGGHFSVCAGIKGYNATVTGGAEAGLASMAYALGVVRNGKAKAIVASGADENGETVSELYARLGLIAEKTIPPYGKGKGFVSSDGCVSLVIESETEARRRGAKAYCRVLGYGFGHKSVPLSGLKGSEDGLCTAINNAFDDAAIQPADVGAIVGFACGDDEIDKTEIEAYKRVFGHNEKIPSIIAVKKRTGEGRAATAALACAHAALLLKGKLTEKDCVYRIGDQTVEQINGAFSSDGKAVLVTSYAFGGGYCALLLGEIKEGE